METKSRSAQRGHDKQRADVKKLQRRMEAGRLLDAQVTHELDDFVKDYGKGNKQFLYSEVERLGRNVVIQAAHFLEAIPAEREIAERSLQALDNVDQDTRWLLNMDAVDLALAFDAKAEQADPHVRSSEVWGQIIDSLKHARDWHKVLLEQFEPIARPPGGRSEVLAQLLVMKMRGFHERQIGKRAPKGRTGRFVRFMQAAWADLRFPELPVDTLGNIAERLPHSKPKSVTGTRQRTV